MSDGAGKNNKQPGEDEGVPPASFRHSTPWRACLGEAEPRRAKLPREEATKE